MTILEEIRTRGHWRVVIRPVTFSESRVPYEQLEDIVRRSAVQLRGWDFPHFDNKAEIQRGVDWVGQESSWEHALEIWRIWMTGQFTSVSGLASDWRDRSRFWPPDDKWISGQVIGVMEILIRFTEVFEFAARLALSPAGDEAMHVSITTGGMTGRTLYVDNPYRLPFAFRPFTTQVDEFHQEFDLQRERLVAETRRLAIAAAHELYLRFGWDSPEPQLAAALEEFGLRS